MNNYIKPKRIKEQKTIYRSYRTGVCYETTPIIHLYNTITDGNNYHVILDTFNEVFEDIYNLSQLEDEIIISKAFEKSNNNHEYMTAFSDGCKWYRSYLEKKLNIKKILSKRNKI